MSNRLNYLKRCIVDGNPIKKINWYVMCFAIPVLKETPDWEKSADLLDIVTRTDGLYYVDIVEEKKSLVKISDHVIDQKLFDFQEKIEVDGSWLGSIPKKMLTKIGVLIVNALVIYPALGKKISYYTKDTEDSEIRVEEFEDFIVSKVRNKDEAKEGDIFVEEMVDCLSRFGFISNLATILNIASTPKVITPAPGTDALRAKLLKEYEGQLEDPIKLVELQNKLEKADNDYLADDKAAKNILNRKSKTARKNLYLIIGETKEIMETEGYNVIAKSLSEGIDTSAENFPKYMNDVRFGSDSRGSSTRLSGYTYKVLQRSLSGISIVSTPCKTKRGLARLITDGNYKKLVTRYIKEGNKWILIETKEQAKKYVGKNVEIRSSMYCEEPGNVVCYACMSSSYKNTPNGITILASNISSVLMSMFLKLNHGLVLETTDIEMVDLIT